MYDALSGKPIENHIKKNVAKPKSIDMISPETKMKSPKHKIAVNFTPDKKNPVKAPATTESVRRPNPEAPGVKSRPKHSSTLHRRSVVRPQINSISTSTSATSVTSTAKKYADSATNKKAMSVEKNQLVSRFGNFIQSESPAKAKQVQSSAKSSGRVAVKSQSVESGSETKERLIKQAVDKAAIKEMPATKKAKKVKSKKFTKYASSFAVLLILTGYIAYLNVPSISMKVAANRAGFSASLPGYTPGGYSLKGPIAYIPGQVTVNFHANTDDRSFSLKQQPTTWDSAALLENFVTKKNPSYSTYQDRGLTIYIYDGSSAAWVNGGKLYSLEGSNSQLDTDQLLKLATSM